MGSRSGRTILNHNPTWRGSVYYNICSPPRYCTRDVFNNTSPRSVIWCTQKANRRINKQFQMCCNRSSALRWGEIMMTVNQWASITRLWFKSSVWTGNPCCLNGASSNTLFFFFLSHDNEWCKRIKTCRCSLSGWNSQTLLDEGQMNEKFVDQTWKLAGRVFENWSQHFVFVTGLVSFVVTWWLLGQVLRFSVSLLVLVFWYL